MLLDMSETEILKEISGAMDKFSTGFLDFAKRSDERFEKVERSISSNLELQDKMLERIEAMDKDHKDNGKGNGDDGDKKVEEAKRMMEEAKRMKEEADKKMQDAEAMAKKHKQSDPEPDPKPEPESQSDDDIDAILADIDRSLSESDGLDGLDNLGLDDIASTDDDIDKLLAEVEQSDPIDLSDMWGEQQTIEDVHRFDNPVINDALEAIRANPEGGLDKIWQNVDAGNYFPRVQPTAMEVLKRSVPGVFRQERT